MIAILRDLWRLINAWWRIDRIRIPPRQNRLRR